MQWRSNPLQNKVGTTRVVKKFLWFPKCLPHREWALKNGGMAPIVSSESYTWRWLETAEYVQEVKQYVDVRRGLPDYKEEWVDFYWKGEPK